VGPLRAADPRVFRSPRAACRAQILNSRAGSRSGRRSPVGCLRSAQGPEPREQATRLDERAFLAATDADLVVRIAAVAAPHERVHPQSAFPRPGHGATIRFSTARPPSGTHEADVRWWPGAGSNRRPSAFQVANRLFWKVPRWSLEDSPVVAALLVAHMA
jgi:hypothetical protein